MNYQLKTCPRCKTQMQQADGAFELIRKRTGSSETSPGLPIAVYSCPQCGYVELYDLRVLGHM